MNPRRILQYFFSYCFARRAPCNRGRTLIGAAGSLRRSSTIRFSKRLSCDARDNSFAQYGVAATSAFSFINILCFLWIFFHFLPRLITHTEQFRSKTRSLQRQKGIFFYLNFTRNSNRRARVCVCVCFSGKINAIFIISISVSCSRR